jgi:hypothetical protein
MQTVSFGSVVHSVANGLVSFYRRSALARFSMPRFFGAASSCGHFAEKPIVVRKGKVAKRRELTQTLNIGGSALHGIRAPQIPLVLFHIDCDDEQGREQILVLIERDRENQSVNVGNSVVVTSQESRFDSSYAFRSVRLNA